MSMDIYLWLHAAPSASEMGGALNSMLTHSLTLSLTSSFLPEYSLIPEVL